MSPYRALDRAFDYDVAFELSQDCARAQECALGLGLNELEKELAALSMPADRAVVKEKQIFAEKLRALMIKHGDIGQKWTLTAIQEVLLAHYLDATSLLQDCLELATMPPAEKMAMLNSLYLPPAQAEDGLNA